MRRFFCTFLCVLYFGVISSAVLAQNLRAPSILVANIAKRELIATLDVTGTLVPRDEVRIIAQVDSLAITKIIAEEGDHVKAGQVLALLDDVTLRSQLAQITANLARAEAANIEAQKALLRTQDLRQKGYATQQQLEQRVSAAKVAAADEEAARAQRTEILTRVSRTEVKAPVAGTISKRMALVGMIVTNAQPLYTLIAKGEIELKAEVADTQHKLLSPNQPARVFPAGDDKGVSGIVRLLSPQIDPLTRLGEVRISLLEENKFAVGSFARAEVETARRAGLAVPLSALAYHQNDVSVQLVVDNKIKTQAVKLGILANGYAEVVQGLKEGDVIVLKAGTFLRDGDIITPVKAEQS
jgi:HlyD family secretion protein